MRPLILAALMAALLPSVAWGPIYKPYRVAELYPRAYVAVQAKKYEVPIPIALAVWEQEASMRINPPDGAAGERGAFQMMRKAAMDAGCNRYWRDMRRFDLSVMCGLKYLSLSIKLCRSSIRGAHRYNNGTCPKRGKVWAYAQEISRLSIKHSQEWR